MAKEPQSFPYPDFLSLNDTLSEQQLLVQKTVRDFVTTNAEPLILNSYRNEEFPKALIPKLGEIGVLGANLSGYDLPGLDAISYGLIMKELERCDSGLRSFASVQGGLVMYPIHAFGSQEQKKYWLPRLASGENIGCFGLTESEGGSDPGAMKTVCEYKDGKWLLNGSKMWITNGNLAHIMVVWAKTHLGIRGFLVRPEQKGVKVLQMKNKLSLRASVTSELYFDKVELAESAILPKSEGLKSALACLSQARYGIAWGVLGAAEACFSEVVRYTKDRKLFSAPLASKQLIQKRLATMLVRLTGGQLLAMRLGQLKDQGQLHFAHVSMGKQNNCELALAIARDCRDILGGNGIMDEYKTMRHMNNLETVITYEGTNDIHLLILGQAITQIAAF